MVTYYCVITTKSKAGTGADIISMTMKNGEKRPENRNTVKGKIAYYNDWFDTFEEAEAAKVSTNKGNFITP
jgi:hypothetical protein